MSDTTNFNYINKLQEEQIQDISFEGRLDNNRLQLIVLQDEEKISKSPRKNKHSFEFVKQAFKDKGCELLEEIYVNNAYPMRYVCSCGKESKKTYSALQQSPNCKNCGFIKIRENKQLSYEFVKNEFEKGGCKLISETYNNNYELLDYICECGNPSKITYGNFGAGHRCRNCLTIKQSKAQTLDYEYVKQFFLDDNYILLEENYINSQQKLKYKCSCGNIKYITFNNFQQGKRCSCRKTKLSKGEISIRTILKNLKIKFIPQHKYSDCKNKHELPFDFFVDNKFIIEFDGEQHFKPNAKFGKNKFKEIQKHDKIKNSYCIENKIPILRISHKEQKKSFSIIKSYLELIKKNTTPSILFTNKDLYQNMYNRINHLTTDNVFMQT